MNIFCRQISIVITFTSPPLLSQYKVQRTDPLATISSSLQLFSLEAEDGTTASLRCPSQTKVMSPPSYIALIEFSKLFVKLSLVFGSIAASQPSTN